MVSSSDALRVSDSAKRVLRPTISTWSVETNAASSSGENFGFASSEPVLDTLSLYTSRSCYPSGR